MTMSFTSSCSSATLVSQSVARCCGVRSSATLLSSTTRMSLSSWQICQARIGICVLQGGPLGPWLFRFCRQSRAKSPGFPQKKHVRTFLCPSFWTGPLGYPPSRLPPTRCSYWFPPGRKSSASATWARVRPGEVSMSFGPR
jgi:hypothetical protein